LKSNSKAHINSKINASQHECNTLQFKTMN
jgi:hypothetical protein